MAAPNRRRKAAAKRKEEINSKALHRFCRERQQAAAPEVANLSSPANRKLGSAIRVDRALFWRRARKKKKEEGERSTSSRRISRALRDPFLKFANSPGQLAKRSVTLSDLYGVSRRCRMFFQSDVAKSRR